MSEGKGILIGWVETDTAKRDFKVFLKDNNLMQRDKPKTDPIVNKVLASFKQRESKR